MKSFPLLGAFFSLTLHSRGTAQKRAAGAEGGKGAEGGLHSRGTAQKRAAPQFER